MNNIKAKMKESELKEGTKEELSNSFDVIML